ncbi:hypothetical protein PoB_004175200 [Plakobranchus ocellatus]|uniref:Uncharacterized protein n=1 Tax=Plakobranchus ocellatus TaxID=259542 RepID=A0AAV4B6V5_9GAST|nr:hypothetical protein PoB_004175200 [Plakobranchus ocellatus]
MHACIAVIRKMTFSPTALLLGHHSPHLRHVTVCPPISTIVLHGAKFAMAANGLSLPSGQASVDGFEPATTHFRRLLGITLAQAPPKVPPRCIYVMVEYNTTKPTQKPICDFKFLGPRDRGVLTSSHCDKRFILQTIRLKCKSFSRRKQA